MWIVSKKMQYYLKLLYIGIEHFASRLLWLICESQRGMVAEGEFRPRLSEVDGEPTKASARHARTSFMVI